MVRYYSVRVFLLVAGLLLLLLTACQSSTPAAGAVEETLPSATLAPETAIPATQAPPEETAVVPTATPAATVAVETQPFTDPEPSTFVKLVAGDPVTLDPGLAYDGASGDILQNIYEPLVTFDQLDPEGFVPALAEAVPSATNGLLSADGLHYTFPIRQGVIFHGGETLTPDDVAYSLQRVLLQSDPTGPAWLLIQPILGYDSGDVTQEIGGGAFAGDRESLLGQATPAELQAVCEKVMDAVTADGQTVTVTLARPWAPFLSVISAFGVIDKDWAVSQGDWDGSCETWAEHYAPGQDGSPLTAIANGTGPYQLDHWSAGEEVVLTAHDGYWRGPDTPLWSDGPYAGQYPTAIIRTVPEWSTRLAALEKGDVDYVEVPYENRAQVEPLVGEWCDYATGACQPDAAHPEGTLRGWDGLPTVQRADIFMNFNVAEGSPYLGSGKLDGEGIPPDFFSDVEVRRAMASCFDYDAYIADLQNGQGVRNNGPIIAGMLGYNPDGPMAEYNLDACRDHLAAAWGGVLPEMGFRLPFVHTPAIPGGGETAAILAEGLSAVNPKYQVEVVELPPPAFFEAMNARQLPIFRGGWLEDFHDPQAWAAPYTVGGYGAVQSLPDDLKAHFAELVSAGVATADPVERTSIYADLQRAYFEAMPAVILSQRPALRVEPRWLDGFTFRVGMFADSPPLIMLSPAGG